MRLQLNPSPTPAVISQGFLEKLNQQDGERFKESAHVLVGVGKSIIISGAGQLAGGSGRS